MVRPNIALSPVESSLSLSPPGPILYFEAFRQPIVVLGSPDTTLEFLDRRSANTSDRKQTPSISL